VLRSVTGPAEASLFGEPILGPILSTGFHGATTTSSVGGDFMMGVDSANQQVSRDLSMFKTMVISESTPQERLRAAHVFIEGFLMKAIPVVVLDWSGVFSGLSLPATDTSEYGRFQINSEPVGFPVKALNVPGEVRLDLNFFPPEEWESIFGFGKSKAGELIKSELSEKAGSITVLKDLNPGLEAKVTDKTGFPAYRATRILKLMELKYGAVLGSPMDPNLLLAPWTGQVGRVAWINLASVKPELANGFAFTVLNALKHKAAESQSQGLKAVVVIPNAGSVVPQTAKALQTRMAGMVQELLDLGVGFILESQSIADINKDLASQAVANVAVVKGKEVGIRHNDGSNPYRVTLRPTLSRTGVAPAPSRPTKTEIPPAPPAPSPTPTSTPVVPVTTPPVVPKPPTA
ncbi:MAG: ATP-binding protein, partial [Candidatus Diapherotrites archaeon]|nr:ATP-binding protein [Candidatus Diapherotrites archaeon]